MLQGNEGPPDPSRPLSEDDPSFVNLGVTPIPGSSMQSMDGASIDLAILKQGSINTVDFIKDNHEQLETLEPGNRPASN